MNRATFHLAAPAAALLALAAAPSLAQRPFVPPEQRIERLERQVQQVQRRVFPQGQPADTAGFYNEPAATQASVSNLDNRLGALERQLANFLRQSEENAYRVNQMEAELIRLRQQEARVRKLEQRLANIPAAGASSLATVESSRPAGPVVRTAIPAAAAPEQSSAGAAAQSDPAEIAYDEGYQLWKSGRYDQAITALRAMASSFPKHRRASWANNLAGRAMLDKGEPRAAAEALLANYRGNPRGERAADSLFYLGQSLMKLNQASQACKAYAEMEAVYGASLRGELQRLLPGAKAEARCG